MTINKQWEDQKLFLKELAEINGIDFDIEKFPDQTRRRGLFKKGYLQSDAALYMAEQIDRLRKSGTYIYFPWNTSPVCVGFNGKRYSLKPWLYIPTIATPKYVKDKDLIKAVTFHESRGQEKYLYEDIRRIGVMLICKECNHQWKHFCGGPGFSGQAPTIPDDILETLSDNGTVLKAFRCPVCGSIEIYKQCEFHWD